MTEKPDIEFAQRVMRLAKQAGLVVSRAGHLRDELCAVIVVHLWEQMRKGKFASKGDGYLLKSARNKATDWLKAHQREKQRTSSEEVDSLAKPEPPAKPKLPESLSAVALEHPLPFVGLFSWNDPSRLDRPLIEHARATPTRGRSETTTGLARDVETTLGLLRAHEDELADGADQKREVQHRFAWIYRDDGHGYEQWRARPREAKQAIETLVKWNQRGKTLAKAKLGGQRE